MCFLGYNGKQLYVCYNTPNKLTLYLYSLMYLLVDTSVIKVFVLMDT